jgi:hypothetical protein
MADNRQFYVYRTKNPDAPGFTDEPMGTMNRWIWRDLKTVRGAVARMTRNHPGISFKLFEFHNFYDDRTFKLVHTHRA